MGSNHSTWFDESKRKVLILTFDADYLSIKKRIEVSDMIGFSSNKLKYRDLNFIAWFLSSKCRHLWRHHYLGTQGAILVFSSKANIISENLIVETLNILRDLNLVNVPFLILFDKSNKRMEEMDLDEKLRNQLSEGKYIFNTQFINFDNVKAMEEIYYGLDWLSEKMKPLKV